ncbi:MAG: hypothetical protein NTW30_05115 [Candidatus Aenigmarchaeota archaeon]|nr:hypothetical protein [Candidatus Aenigmarchaeota archaeon]
MQKNCVGIDKDSISDEEAKALEKKIIKEQMCQVIVYKTKRGFHFILIFDKDISKKENFEIRNKYGDCLERVRRSLLRSEMPGVPYDTLFSIKDGHWRKRVE